MSDIASRFLMGILFVGTAVSVTAASAAPLGDDSGLIAECSRASLPVGALQDCLERARVLGETVASPELQSLVSTLERRIDQSETADASTGSEGEMTVPRQLTKPLAASGGASTGDREPDDAFVIDESALSDDDQADDPPPSEMNSTDDDSPPVIDPGDDPGPPP